LGSIQPYGFTRNGTFYYHSSSPGPSLFTATLNLEKGTAIATPLASEKFNLLDTLYLGDWSPDGEHLAYWATRSREVQEMKIVSMKTGQTRVLKPGFSGINHFRWSPDGRSIIANAHGPNRPIYEIDTTSGQVTTPVKLDEGGDNGPVWSHDGQGIVLGKRPGDAGGAFRIVHRDLKTQSERDLLTPGNPVFDGKLSVSFDLSPDGDQLALLAKPNDESMALWLIPVNGGAPRELLKVNTSPGTTAGDVGWTPDGQFVLYSQLRGDEKERGLWYISANGGQPRKIALSGVEGKNVGSFAVHPDGKQLAIRASGPANPNSGPWKTSCRRSTS
jgi:Tol biopolymer transport system component